MVQTRVRVTGICSIAFDLDFDRIGWKSGCLFGIETRRPRWGVRHESGIARGTGGRMASCGGLATRLLARCTQPARPIGGALWARPQVKQPAPHSGKPQTVQASLLEPRKCQRQADCQSAAGCQPAPQIVAAREETKM